MEISKRREKLILKKPNITINRDGRLEGIMFNPFKKDSNATITLKEKQKKERQEERRQRAQARGQKPIK